MKVASITADSTELMKANVQAGKYQFIVFTPDLLIMKSQWRNLLLTEVYKNRIKAFVVDEAHCQKVVT